MSRKAVILLVVLCGAIAAILVVSKKRASQTTDVAQAITPPVDEPAPATPAKTGQTVTRPINGAVPTPPPSTVPAAPGTSAEPGRTAVAEPRNPLLPQTPRVAVPPIQLANTNDLEIKPLPVLEKDYASATNRDARLDIMMDISEMPGAESVRALTRLFEIETDPDLKVDLLDSLLGIEGFTEEKLIMLTMGARPGLPSDVRQSAIDGLIDLDDPRVIPVLNGLLNDPDPEIREGAQDALELMQSQPLPTVKIIGK